jgi:hypothetical protein
MLAVIHFRTIDEQSKTHRTVILPTMYGRETKGRILLAGVWEPGANRNIRWYKEREQTS